VWILRNMKSISLQDSRLIWSPEGTQVIDWPLESIRCAYLFLPQGFTWRALMPSETTYRYLDLDQLGETDFKDLLVQLLVLSKRFGKHLHFVLKGFLDPPFVCTFKELVEKNVDLMLALRDTREARLARQEAWLKENPSVSCHGVVFGLTGVHKNGRTTFWRDLDNVEINRLNTIITLATITYVPTKPSPSMRVIQRIPPKALEECLTEINFWRHHALPPEALCQQLQRQTTAHDHAISKQKKALLITAAIILGFVLFAVPFALLTTAARPH
jgi:hypothetical protein